jgi:hypothetical protein
MLRASLSPTSIKYQHNEGQSLRDAIMDAADQANAMENVIRRISEQRG